MNLQQRGTGALLGLAVGDAVGTTLEFKPRGTFEPIDDMVGGGPFHLEPGQWTDDTSMALCLAESLLECDGFDGGDQLRRYVRWFREGHLSSNGRCFDIGLTVRQALRSFEETGEWRSGSTHPMSAGNGSIMRLAPIVLRYFPSDSAIDHYAGESSKTTHQAAEAIAACRILAAVLSALLGGASKDEAVSACPPADWMSERLRGIAEVRYRGASAEDIRGSGYCVDSLEAALWCFLRTDSFESAILDAANLGDDADTTAAVCGQIAGAYYGLDGIPSRWSERIVMRERIVEWAARLMAAQA